MFFTIFLICHMFQFPIQFPPKRSTVVFVMIIFVVVVLYSCIVSFRSSSEHCFQTKDTVWCINVSRLATNTVACIHSFSFLFSSYYLFVFDFFSVIWCCTSLIFIVLFPAAEKLKCEWKIKNKSERSLQISDNVLWFSAPWRYPLKIFFFLFEFSFISNSFGSRHKQSVFSSSFPLTSNMHPAFFDQFTVFSIF